MPASSHKALLSGSIPLTAIMDKAKKKHAKAVLKQLEERLEISERQREAFLEEKKHKPKSTNYDRAIDAIKEQIAKVKEKYGV